jgi:hypothetical protein
VVALAVAASPKQVSAHTVCTAAAAVGLHCCRLWLTYGVTPCARCRWCCCCVGVCVCVCAQVHRAVYKTRFPVAVKMLTDPGLRCPDRDTLKSFR